MLTIRLMELATQSGLSVRTVRYYVDRGLVRPARRSSGGYRLFDENAVRQLRFIRRLHGLGLTLRDLHQLLAAAERQSCGQSSVAVERRLRIQLDAVELRLQELQGVRHELASLLARKGDGCTDELCLCNRQQVIQIGQARRVAGPRA